jgi:hypothetical protein
LPPGGGEGNVDHGGGRHRADEYPSENWDAGQGERQKPDPQQGTDRCGATERMVLNRGRLPRGRRGTEA